MGNNYLTFIAPLFSGYPFILRFNKFLITTILSLPGIFFLHNTVSAQNLKRAFKNLEKNKIEAARGAFLGTLIESPNDIIANYGLATIYSKDIFSGKDYMQAFVFICNAKSCLKLASVSELKEANSLLPDCDSIINELFENIDDKLFVDIKTNNNLNFINNHIFKLENSNHFTEIVDQRSKLEFIKAKTSNSLESINEFISKFPNAKEIDQAIKIRNKFEFKIAKSKDIIFIYNEFIAKHPEDEELEETVRLRNLKAFKLANTSNTLESYDFFMHNYPTAIQMDQVIALRIQKAFEQALEINTIEALQRFIYMNPNSQQVDSAIVLRDLLVFEQIKVISTNEAFNQFISNYPFAKQAFGEFLTNYPKLKDANLNNEEIEDSE